MFFLVNFWFIFVQFQQILSKECPQIQILNPYKSRTWIIEGIQIHNSTIRLLRGGSQPGTSQPINNVMIWDMSNNHMLKMFEIDIQITKMLYCKRKRKLLALGLHKILDIHPQSFNVIDEYNIGGSYIEDVEDSDSLLLISRDKGNPFLYDIYQRQIVETLPYEYQNVKGPGWASFAILKDFNILVTSKLMLFDRNNGNKIVAFIQKNIQNSNMNNLVCSYKQANFIVTSNWTNIIMLGTIYKDQQGETQYQQNDYYQEPLYQIPSGQNNLFLNLYCITRGNDYFVVGLFGRTDGSSNIFYNGATVLKIQGSIDQNTGQPAYKLQVQEQWKYRRWRKDMEFFLFDESTHRGHSISEYEHYSYEFLESDEAQCDFDGDGVIDPQCRVAKTISQWPWNLDVGVYFLGSNQEYFIQANDNYKGYQIRDWNQTEIARIKYPRLIEKKQFSLRRVLQDPNSTYKLAYDTYIKKMNWDYGDFSEMQAGFFTNSGFYIYQQISLQQSITETYNLISYMNPINSPAKYLNPYDIITAFTYKDSLNVCVFYNVLEVNVNDNGQTVDNQASYQYFQYHNKECYKLKNEQIQSFYQLKQNKAIEYGKGLTGYSKCTPYFTQGFLVCKNTDPSLEFWSLDDYTLVKTFSIAGCLGNYDLAIHRNRIFVGCDTQIIIYNDSKQEITTFTSFQSKVILFIVAVEDILTIAYSTMEINVFDLRPLDGSIITVLQYLNPQDCCIINSIEINPKSKKLIWAANIQINFIDLSSCFENPQDCLSCEINSYFKFDSNFSFLQQKYERAKWTTAQPGLHVNPKFLDSGQGTIQNPYLTDMNIMQLYLKTELYKQGIINFKNIVLNIYIDTSKEYQMSHYIFDWVHDQTYVNFQPWDGKTSTGLSNQKIKIIINSPQQFNFNINKWEYVDMTDIQVICPYCSSNTLSIQNSGQVYLRNFILTLKLSDLSQQQITGSNQINSITKIQVNNVNIFSLENQKIQDSKSDDLNTVPFLSFNSCKQVILKNLIFANIVNQESLFESINSNFILDQILFTNINTCQKTQTQRTKFSLIPFQNLQATNIQFIDNQFCDICLFQNIVSSSDLSTNQINVSNIEVSGNKFDKYVNSNVIFFKMSLVQLISTSSYTVQMNNITFYNNKGNLMSNGNGNSYYFEFTKLSSVTMNHINITDESFVGIGSFNKIQQLTVKGIYFINSKYMNMDNADQGNLIYSQNGMLFQEIDSVQLLDSLILGMSSNGIIAVQIQECERLLIQNLTVKYCSFHDSLFSSIQNQNNQISSITIIDSIFNNNKFDTEQSYIQIGLFQIKAEKSPTVIILNNATFTNNKLSVNQNTQKKSSLTISIENSISNITITNCTFHNYLANGIIGDLFLNVQSFYSENTTFKQNFGDLADPSLGQSEILSLLDRSSLKGAFLQLQVQQAIIVNNSFSNAISYQGAISVQPNNNFLQISVVKSQFTNLYASQTGTSLFVSSLSSPTNISISDSFFQNQWLGNQQKLTKAHLYFESSSKNKNQINITNIEFYSVGNVKTQQDIPQPSYFLYSDSFNLIMSTIKLINDNKSHLMRNLFSCYSFKSRIAQQNKEISLASLFDRFTFYGSSVIYSSQGIINITDVEILGSIIINNKYNNIHYEIQSANFLTAQSSVVNVNGLKVYNLNTNMNGGLIQIQNSQSAKLSNIYLTNLNQIQAQSDQFQLYQESDQSFAFINCIHSDCLIDTLNATCNIQSSIQNCQGRVINSQKGSLYLKNSNISNFILSNQNGTALFIESPKQNLLIEECSFNSLQTSGYGAAIYLHQSDILLQSDIKIRKNNFQKNIVQKQGGAISFEGYINEIKSVVNIEQNTFEQNEAYISGAIYFNSYYLTPDKFKNNIFDNNKAKMGNEIYSMPSNLSVKLITDDGEEILVSKSGEYTLIHGSGLQLPKIEVTLYYQDFKGEYQIVDNSLLTKQKEILEISMSQDQKNSVKSSDSNSLVNYFMRGNLFSSYNEEQNSIYFSNIELYGQENTEVYLIITSPIIKKKQIVEQNGNIQFEDYKFIINIRFRGCTKYEIITSNQISQLNPNISKCQVCPDLSYSRNKEVCDQCQIGANCKANQELIVKSGYWRESNQTYTILTCLSGFESCKGGQTVGNELCEIGYIGPLCQECDLFNIRGFGRYSRLGKTVCKICKFDFISLIMVLGTLIISVYFTIRAIYSISNYLKAQILVKFMKTLKFKRIREVDQLQSQNILIKILMTYFQLISIIRTIEIKIPNFLPEISFYFGNPATNSTMNVNCLLPEYLIDVHYIFYNYFISLFIPVVHFFFLALSLKLLSLYKRESFNASDLKAGIIFFFTYFQPEFVYQAIQLITCKTYDNKTYNQANTSLECRRNFENILVLSIIILLLGFFIPLMLFAKLTAFMKDKRFNDQSFQLENCQYAFLSINYKTKSYYWEFVRMSERLLFILIASIFNSNQTLKILLLIFVSEGYNYILRIQQPFKNSQFNSLEIYSNHVICISFLLAIGIYSEEETNGLSIFYYVLFLIINWLIITYILLLVMQEQVNKITDKMISVIEKNKCIRCIFESFLHCLNKIPFFRLNFDLKLYLSKKKKPQLYEKVRQSLVQLLKLPHEDRNIFFLSIKEQKNKSKFISNMMNQFKSQYQQTSPSKNNNQSPKQSLQQKLDKILVTQSDQENEASFATKNKNQIESKNITQINLFSSFRNQNIQQSFANNLSLNKEKSYAQSQLQNNLNKKFVTNSFDLELSNIPKDHYTNNQLSPNSKTDIQSSLSELKQNDQQLYKFPIQKLQSITEQKLNLQDKNENDYLNSAKSQISPLKDSQTKSSNMGLMILNNQQESEKPYFLQQYKQSFSNILQSERKYNNLNQQQIASNSIIQKIDYQEDQTNNNENNYNENSVISNF
ncbi:hypothetical protein ABPG74_019012 [Tetrahymena malaccensis]